MRTIYAPDLIEETVLAAEVVVCSGDAQAFRRERDRIYERSDPDRRELEFRALHLAWFARLGLSRAVGDILNEFPELGVRLGEARVLRALTRREEGADLLDQLLPGASHQPLLVVRLRPATLLDHNSLETLLRHELMHVVDMLDPGFGYERSLPSSDDGPSADNILRDRYRVLWDTTIDGRLVRSGKVGPGAREARRREFVATFMMLGERGGDAFAEWFDQPRPTHAAMVAFAQSPHETGSGPSTNPGRCPLCRFPVAALEPHPSRLSAAAEAILRADFPGWVPKQGLCAQCLDLYEARREETADVGR